MQKLDQKVIDVNWLFGRGLSMGCNLKWEIPSEWGKLCREECIDLIKKELTLQMDYSHVDTSSIKDFIKALSDRTNAGFRHRLITTNRDYLLQKEISALQMIVLPKWLASSHVSHLNGTIEVLRNNCNRSPFLLESDDSLQRTWSVEANKVFSEMKSNKVFIVVGMSFECETDRFLLSALNKVQDDLPIGESTWIISNPDSAALRKSSRKIQRALPYATITRIKKDFSSWLESGMTELVSMGVLTPVSLGRAVD